MSVFDTNVVSRAARLFQTAKVWCYGRLPRRLSGLAVRLVKPTYPLAVVVVVCNDHGEYLLLRHTYHQPPWRLPGGLVERGESIMDAAVREVAEEANCRVRPIGVVDARVVGPTLDVVVLAELVEEAVFVPNAETDAKWWVSAHDLRQDIAIIHSAHRLVQQVGERWARFNKQNSMSDE